MTLAELLTTLSSFNWNELIKGGGGVVVLLMTIIQVSKIQINPWSALARAIGKAMNGELIKKLDVMDKEIKDLRTICDERDATLRRTHILRFNDEILHQKEHTKEHFDQILVDIKEYEDYCKDHKEYENNIAGCAIENIQHTYKKCMDEHTFL